MLRKTQFVNASENDAKTVYETRVLPSRLTDWKLAQDGETFVYAGDEVDLSVWNTDLAFIGTKKSYPDDSHPSKKRKRNEDLFHGEIWRAHNVWAIVSFIGFLLSQNLKI
jgi:ribosome biogenesis protein NSA1